MKTPKGFTTTKPANDHEFILITKTGKEYKLWLVKNMGSYYGLCTGDGIIWGHFEDLEAELYRVV